ncbi:DUF262 domain-containing protein [Clostridium felsineum]|uniref:DUF262 domain-containing protein n=1 Tax=Clostridium felsineum TaxID=36839 RepID=UPI00098C3BB1|nr:DUF262 domain-containing protein [Clostridium felsineum]URZ01705.1 hypothetical protein CLAUR_017000 [Clostridium felsineum]
MYELDKCIEEEKAEEDAQFAENAGIIDEEDSGINYEEKRNLLNQTKIAKQTWSILEIYQKIKEGKLQLSPEYQRRVIWDKKKKTAFIESLFMGIVVPPIYVVEIPGEDILDGTTYEVVDGKQRLSTIESFVKNDLELDAKALEYYKDWFGGKKFVDIKDEYFELTNEMLSSVLDIYVITANSPEFTKYDIFSRLNKGAEKLKVNEIRKAIYISTTLKIIDDYVNSNVKTEYYKRFFSANDIKRYEDYGRFYSSIAYYINTDFENRIVKDYNSRPREMINDVLYNIQKKKIVLENDKLNEIIQNTMKLLEYFQGKTYSKYMVDSCIAFAVKFNEKFWDNIESISENIDIKNTLDKSPSTTSKVNARLGIICDILGV